MNILQLLSTLWEILYPIGKEIIEGIRNNESNEEIAKRAQRKIEILGPELDLLRNRKKDLEDYIKTGR